MQEFAWDDLRYLLAAQRGRSFAEAGRLLGVNETTVLRRLSTLEKRLGCRLLDRRKAALGLTEAGALLAAHAERAEIEIETALGQVGGRDGLVAGTVRVTAVPVLLNRVLARALPALVNAHPGLSVELIADSRDLSLGRRETDIALRMARPRDEGEMLTRRIATLDYGIYVPRGRRMADLPWLLYGEAMAHLPQNGWIEKNRKPGESISGIRVNDAEAMIACAARGLGRAILPRLVGSVVPELQEVPGGCDLSREVWMIVHPALRRTARVEAVTDWIGRTLGQGH